MYKLKDLDGIEVCRVISVIHSKTVDEQFDVEVCSDNPISCKGIYEFLEDNKIVPVNIIRREPIDGFEDRFSLTLIMAGPIRDER